MKNVSPVSRYVFAFLFFFSLQLSVPDSLADALKTITIEPSGWICRPFSILNPLFELLQMSPFESLRIDIAKIHEFLRAIALVRFVDMSDQFQCMFHCLRNIYPYHFITWIWIKSSYQYRLRFVIGICNGNRKSSRFECQIILIDLNPSISFLSDQS